MAMPKYGHAAVVGHSIDPGKWIDKKVAPGRVKVAKQVIAEYDPAKWLLSHATIIASVDVDQKDPNDPKSNFLIKPEYSAFVNNNGDSWERNLLKSCYHTFIGADNYVEHVQIPELSKGKIIDAAIREVPFAKDTEGNDLTTLYVDILVATNLKHRDLVDKIKTGEYNAMSMGCGLAGTRIIMPDGTYKNIEDIKVGDLVVTHTGNNRRVTSLFSMDVKQSKLIGLYSSGSEDYLRLTEEHPVLIARKKSVNCSLLNCKRPCIIEKKQKQCYWESKKKGLLKKNCGRDKENYSYEIEFVPISNVGVGDYLVKSYNTEEIDIELYTEDYCRLLGLYAGDGYIIWQWGGKEKKYPNSVEFCIGTHEKNLKDDIVKILNRNFVDKFKIREVKERNGTYIKIFDKDFAKFCFNNAGEGAWNKKFSKEVMQLPYFKQKLILSGLFDTDGCVNKKGLTYYTVSDNMLNQVQIMLYRNKIPSRINKVNRKGTGKKSKVSSYVEKSLAVSNFYLSKIWFIKNTGYGQDQKISSNEGFFYRNYYLSPIRKKSELYINAKVYNFSVEEDESYLIDNVSVHNCLIEYSQCSKCGNIAKDETQACKHILYFKKNFFYDESGNKRIIAELCGRSEDPESCKFIEGSWVKKPAFEGALLRNIVNPTDDLSEKLQVAVAVPSSIPSVGDFAKAASATAGHLVRQIQAQEGEEEAPAEPPKDDAGFPEAPEGEGTPLDVDKPEGEETPDAGGAAGGGLGDVPAEGPGAEPAVPVPEGDPSVKEVKDLLKRHVLQEIRDELIQNSYNIEPRNTETSPAMENAMNESLVKQAAFKKVIASAKKLGNDRLTNGLLILTNLKNWKSLKRYGYNREDVIGLMHYIDKEASQDPLDSDLVKALASTKESSNLKEFFTDIIVETGKELTPKQARKLAGWRKILRKI